MILALGAMTVGCDRTEASYFDSNNLNGALGEGELVVPEENPIANGDISPPNTPADPVTVLWIDGTTGEPQDELAVSITNISEQTSTFLAQMSFIGLGSTSSIDLGELELSPGESEEFSVGASDVPIQVLAGACQAVVSVSRIPAVDGGRAEFPVLSDVRFYRHVTGYETLLSMTGEELKADNGGVMLGTDLNVDSGGEFHASTIGRKKGASGIFADVSGISEHLIQRDEHGNIISVVIGHSIGTGEDEPKSALEATEVEDAI